MSSIPSPEFTSVDPVAISTVSNQPQVPGLSINLNTGAKLSGSGSSSKFIASLSRKFGSHFSPKCPSSARTNFAFTTTFSPQLNGRAEAANLYDRFSQRPGEGIRVSSPLSKLVEFFHNAFSESSESGSRISEVSNEKFEDFDPYIDENPVLKSVSKQISDICFHSNSSGFVSSRAASASWTSSSSQNSSLCAVYSSCFDDSDSDSGISSIFYLGIDNLIDSIASSGLIEMFGGIEGMDGIVLSSSCGPFVGVSISSISTSSSRVSMLSVSSLLSPGTSEYLSNDSLNSRGVDIPYSSPGAEVSLLDNTEDNTEIIFYNQIFQKSSEALTPTRLEEAFTQFMQIRNTAAQKDRDGAYTSSNDEVSLNEGTAYSTGECAGTESPAISESSLWHFDTTKARVDFRKGVIGEPVSIDSGNEKCFKAFPEPKAPRESHPRLLGRKIADKVKATTHIIAAWAGNINKDNNNLWSLLALERIPFCQKFRQEFLADANYSVFYNAQSQLSYPIFKDFTLVLANLAAQAGAELPADRKQTVKFDFGSPSVGLRNSASSLVPTREISRLHVPVQSILKGTTYKYYTNDIAPKEFKHELSEKQRDTLRAEMFSKVEECQYRLVVLKLEFSPENIRQMIDSCIVCFKFVTNIFAVTAKSQMVDYMTHIVDIRKHIMSAFDTLNGLGHEFALFLDVLANSTKNASELSVAFSKMESMYASLAQANSLLADVQIAIGQLEAGSFDYIEAMVRDAEATLLAREELLRNYLEFWKITVEGDEDSALILDEISGVKEFFLASKFLSDHSDLFKIHPLVGSVEELKCSHGIVKDIQIEIELVFDTIITRVFEMQNSFQNTNYQ